MSDAEICTEESLSNRTRLLNQPFDFSAAFDRALKDTIVTFPNRPSKEQEEDTVGSACLYKAFLTA